MVYVSAKFLGNNTKLFDKITSSKYLYAPVAGVLIFGRVISCIDGVLDGKNRSVSSTVSGVGIILFTGVSVKKFLFMKARSSADVNAICYIYNGSKKVASVYRNTQIFM